MDIHISIKIFSLLAVIIAAAKFIYELIVGKKSGLREEYRFAKEFLIDIRDVNLHLYAKEKGYQAIAGSTVIDTNEIEYILSLKKPVRRLKDFVLSRNYLCSIDGNKKLRFKEKYNSWWSRFWRKSLFGTLYMIFGMSSLLPFIFASRLGDIDLSKFLLLIIMAISFAYFAFESLKSSVRIYRGEQLIANQNKHTSAIFINTKLD